jgi:hypothetical protein
MGGVNDPRVIYAEKQLQTAKENKDLTQIAKAEKKLQAAEKARDKTHDIKNGYIRTLM